MSLVVIIIITINLLRFLAGDAMNLTFRFEKIEKFGAERMCCYLKDGVCIESSMIEHAVNVKVTCFWSL